MSVNLNQNCQKIDRFNVWSYQQEGLWYAYCIPMTSITLDGQGRTEADAIAQVRSKLEDTKLI